LVSRLRQRLAEAVGADQQFGVLDAAHGIPVNGLVFVVDGDVAVASGLESMLRAYRLDVRTFPSAEALLDSMALTAPGSRSPSCLITELGLPGISGLKLLQQLREGGQRLPVILIANHTDVQSAVQAMRAGALDFLEKPFSQELLLDRVGEALRTRSRTPGGRSR
jgi:FixJ family two-component response regulator